LGPIETSSLFPCSLLYRMYCNNTNYVKTMVCDAAAINSLEILILLLARINVEIGPARTIEIG